MLVTFWFLFWCLWLIFLTTFFGEIMNRKSLILLTAICLLVSAGYAEIIEFERPVWDVSFTSDGSVAVVTSIGPDVYIMNTESRQIEQEVYIGQPTVSVLVHPSGDFAYLAGTNTLFKLNLNDYSVETVYSPFRFVAGMVFSLDGERLFVSHTDGNEVLVFQVSDSQLIHRIPVNYPYEVLAATDWSGEVLWVCSNRDNRIYRYDINNYVRTLRVNVDAPKAIEITGHGDYFWVMNHGNYGRLSWIFDQEVRQQYFVQYYPNDLVATEDTIYTVTDRGYISKLNVFGNRSVDFTYIGGRLIHAVKNPVSHEIYITRNYGGGQIYILDISPKPDIAIEQESLEFGDVEFHRTQTGTITISNDGGVDLIITGVYVDNDQVYINSQDGLTISPGDNYVLDLTFTPIEVGVLNATLSVISNDPDTPELAVEITGIGIWVPADELLGRMVHYVSDLQAGNVMNRGQVNSLTTKLEQAITRLHRDHLRQALNILNTFQNQISGFIAVGVLPEVNGIYLLDESSFILDMLCEFGIAADGISLHLQNSLPGDCFLSQAYPNPFNSSTQMSFTLPGPEKVQMQVYNLTGKMVSTIQDGCLSTGVHSVNWHAGDLPGGIYIVQFKAGSFQGYNKVALVR